jgi:hypothetical protein
MFKTIVASTLIAILLQLLGAPTFFVIVVGFGWVAWYGIGFAFFAWAWALERAPAFTMILTLGGMFQAYKAFTTFTY